MELPATIFTTMSGNWLPSRIMTDWEREALWSLLFDHIEVDRCAGGYVNGPRVPQRGPLSALVFVRSAPPPHGGGGICCGVATVLPRTSLTVTSVCGVADIGLPAHQYDRETTVG
jgi:hypothetical protein